MPVGKAHWPKVAAYRLQGMSPTDISRELGVSPSAVSTTLTHPEFAAMYEEQQALFLAEVRADIIRGAKVGVQSMIRLATGEPAVSGGSVAIDEETGRPIYTVPHSVQGKASMDLATLAGLKETNITISGSLEGRLANQFSSMTPEQIREILAEDTEQG